MNINRIVIVLFFLMFFVWVNQAQAVVLKQITATPSNVTAGNVVSYTIIFETFTAIPADGKILIEFPIGFDVSGATFTSWTGFDGGQTLSVDSQTITITRNGTGSSAASSVKTIVLGNIVNSLTTANDYQVIITTKNAVDGILDGSTLSIYFQLFFSHSETTIDGIYYLKDNAQTHYQNYGDPGGIDLGTFSRTPPTSDGNRNCSSWIQFYFDENGTYTQINQLTNIYYHIWWQTNVDQGTLGYDKTGYYGTVTNESFTVDTNNSPNKVRGHYLFAGKQILSSPQSILGNAIYNFGIKFLNSDNYPTITFYPNKSSFIILNLPDDVTLQSLDSDGDLLTDYDELFTYYTNPYDADTDNDNWNDKYEVDNNLNPIDPDQAPSFGKFLIQQYNGLAANDRFGTSVSSISDIDGDDKNDVLVGAHYADPNGFSNAGSAYIYSSSTGELIRQYNGLAANDNFGTSVSSISDIDGDRRDDVLVGSSDSTYIYSSLTGNLIQQYDAGSFVSSISDIDGDGKDDVLVGDPSSSPGGLSGAGSAYIYSSNTGELIRQYNGGAEYDYFGLCVSSISDIDGKDDVLVGAPYADPGGINNAGSAYLYSSNTGELIKQYNGLAANDNFGVFVSSISDIDEDGKDDVLIGAPNSSPGGITGAGSVYLYSSNTGELIKKYNGRASGDYFGTCVSSISDIDGDDKDDVLVGARYADPNGLSNAGSAYIYSSSTSELIKQYNGLAADDYFGDFVSSISDIDGDGKDDVLVGVPYADPNGLSKAGSVYIYSLTGNIPIQSWSKVSSKTNAFDLDDYFSIDPNNSTIPARNQTVTYTASTVDNPYIDVSIDADNQVSFSQPDWWMGTETVTFTATDSTGLSSQSNTVTLEVTGEREISDDNNDYRCFLTTLFGTVMAKDEDSVLCNARKFRDSYLLTNPVGEIFVSAYYRISPALAKIIRESAVLKNTVRSLLYPLVWAVGKI